MSLVMRILRFLLGPSIAQHALSPLDAFLKEFESKRSGHAGVGASRERSRAEAKRVAAIRGE